MARRDNKTMPLLDGLSGYDAARGVRTEEAFLDGFDPFEAAERAAGQAPAAVAPPPVAPRRDTGSQRPGDRDAPLSVAAAIRAAVGALDASVGTVWIQGETCELKRAASGHLYFGLKDDSAKLDCVMWASDARRQRFALENGMRLLCRGQLGIFERSGRFQLYVKLAEPAGVGAEALALEQLKQKLAAEGLFDDGRKRELPPLPRRVGVVTSATGAAVRDIIRVAHRRFPVPILVAGAQVQGPEAPRQICDALAAIASQPVDVVIVGRGGGGASDLSAFNDERVVRAIAACPVPTISAVGHEVDVTLADLVADRRAATPSAAAEMAVPVRDDLVALLHKEERRLARELELRISTARQELDQQVSTIGMRLEAQVQRRRRQLAEVERTLQAQHPAARVAGDRSALRELAQRCEQAIRAAVEPRRGLVSELAHRGEVAATRRMERSRSEFVTLASRLDALSPLRVLDRGFAVATHAGKVISAAQEVESGDTIAVRLAAGTLDCRVEAVHPPEDHGGKVKNDPGNDQAGG